MSIHYSGQAAAQPHVWFDAVELCGLDQRRDDRPAGGPALAAGEQAVLRPRAIGRIALSRKNSLFAGSEGGAAKWAIVASLVKTAKLNEIEPFAWLRDSLAMMVGGHPSHCLKDLLPMNRMNIRR